MQRQVALFNAELKEKMKYVGNNVTKTNMGK